MPEGYEVGILVKGLSAPSSATVDAEGNIWVAVSPPLLGSPDKDQFEEAHVKVFDPQGKLIKEIGKGTFTTVMNEISFCAENGKIYIPKEYAEKIWEVDGIDAEPKLIIKDLMIGDHRNGGVTCKDGYLYFALGLPSNTGFADPDNHGWTDIPNDPFWLAHPDGHPATPHDPVCRDIVHTGLNVKSSDGRLTGALLPVGVPATPGMKIKATSAMRRLGHADQDGCQPGRTASTRTRRWKSTLWASAISPASPSGPPAAGSRTLSPSRTTAPTTSATAASPTVPRRSGW